MSSASSGQTVQVVMTIAVVTALLLAGCAGDREYSTSISEPTTGDVIDDVSIYEVNPIDGTRLEMNYSIDATDNRTYYLRTYELQNGSYEPQTSYRLESDERTMKFAVTIPNPRLNESVIKEQIRVERGENRTVVDAVTVTVRLDE